MLFIIGQNTKETKTIDSIGYESKHNDWNSAKKETLLMSKKLSEIGYIKNKITNANQEKTDTLFCEIALNKPIEYIHIYIGENKPLDNSKNLSLNKDTIIIKYNKTQDYLNNLYQELESAGKPFSKIKLQNIQQKDNYIIANLNIESENKRVINSIIYKYETEKKSNTLPQGFQKFINKKFINKVFKKETIQEFDSEIKNIGFIKQTKYPEVLFKKDSTIIYTYLQKNSSNTFDGYIGLSNDKKNKPKPNGYLDIQLQNLLNKGESFSLYWKNNGLQQKTFDTQIEIPFIFKSPFLIKGELHIYTQDSTFQNTSTAITLGYIKNLNSKINLNYYNTTSGDIQNTNSNLIKDYTKKIFSLNYIYKKNKFNNALIDSENNLQLNIGQGTRTTPDPTNLKTQQTIISTEYNHVFKLNTNNYINIRNINFLLKSNNYLTNELYRFGGLTSIRGFRENELQANYTSFINTTYYYLLNPNLSVNSIVDFGVYQDKTDINSRNRLNSMKSFGINFNVKTNNNTIKLSLINGSINKQKIEFYNTILTICYNVKF